MGLQHRALADNEGVAFAITSLKADFLAPAVIDDLLEIVTEIESTKGPILTFKQLVRKDGVALVTASVDVATIRGNRAVRPPREILKALRP